MTAPTVHRRGYDAPRHGGAPTASPPVSPADKSVVSLQLLDAYLIAFRPQARIPGSEDARHRLLLRRVRRLPQPGRQASESRHALT
jgi:hypothetical protein